jgi:hypothetical protein
VLSSRKLSRQGINSSKAHKRTSHLSLLGSLEQKRKLSSNTFPFKLQKLTPYFFPTAAHPLLCKPPRKEPTEILSMLRNKGKILHFHFHEALIQFMADTSRQFTEAIARMPQPNNQAKPLGCSLRDFSSHNFR